MQPDIYELVALGMRYWFVLLGVIILLRAAAWALKDHRAYRRTLMALPDAGLMGEIVNIETGEAQPLPREGVIGSGRTCDVRLPGLRAREVEFMLKEGTGVHVMPCHMRHAAVLDGQALNRRKSWAAHGSRLSLPGYYLRFRLFAGLDVPSVSYQGEHPSHGSDVAAEKAFDMESLTAIDGLEGIPLEPHLHGHDPNNGWRGHAPQTDLDMTWIYAIPPAGDLVPSDDMPEEDSQQGQHSGIVFRRGKRRSRRHEP